MRRAPKKNLARKAAAKQLHVTVLYPDGAMRDERAALSVADAHRIGRQVIHGMLTQIGARVLVADRTITRKLGHRQEDDVATWPLQGVPHRQIGHVDERGVYVKDASVPRRRARAGSAT